MKDNLSIQNLKRRFTSESPSFFKKLIKLGLSIGAASTAVLIAPATLTAAGVTIALPTILTTLATHGIVVGTLTAAVSKFTVTPQESATNDEVEELRAIDRGEKG